MDETPFNLFQTFLNDVTFKCPKRVPNSVQVQLSDEALPMRTQCKDSLCTVCLLPARSFWIIHLGFILRSETPFPHIIKHKIVFTERCNLISNERKYFELRELKTLISFEHKAKVTSFRLYCRESIRFRLVTQELSYHERVASIVSLCRRVEKR